MSDVLNVTALIDRIAGTVVYPAAWSHPERSRRTNSFCYHILAFARRNLVADRWC